MSTYWVEKDFDDARRAIDELLALREADRWVPVGERLPEEGKFTLVLDGDHTPGLDPDCTVAWLDENAKWQGELTTLRVTHWRPLPAPLEEK